MTTADPDDPVHIRFASAGTNWLTISSYLMIDMKAGGTPDPNDPNRWRLGSQIDVVAPPINRAALTTVEMVGRGEAEVAVTSCPDTIYMARNGIGPFSEAYDINTIARLPHDDKMAFAVREQTGIESIQQIRDEEIGLDIARRLPGHPPHRDVSGFVQDEILREYGITDERIEEWGGSVDYGARKQVNAIKDGEFDAIFDEALMSWQWREIAESADLRFLPIDEEVIEFLKELYHMERKVISEGYLPGVEEDLPTVGKAGWILLTRNDTPEAAIHRVLEALDNQKEKIHQHYLSEAAEVNGTEPPMTSEPDLSETWKDTGGPLHPGAEQYYEEHGYK